MAPSEEHRSHQEWLGYLQPVGLVVSPPALVAAQAHINKNIVPEVGWHRSPTAVLRSEAPGKRAAAAAASWASWRATGSAESGRSMDPPSSPLQPPSL